MKQGKDVGTIQERKTKGLVCPGDRWGWERAGESGDVAFLF
jgi:hypothetical protein